MWASRIKGSIARSRKVKGGNYVQIATVDSDGFPHNRTVVFRGFVQGETGQGMQMITDARSEKVQHIKHSPACELNWWFAKSSEQFRIRGELQLVGADDSGTLQAARKQQWGNLRDTAREQFFWDAPGVDFTGKATPPAGGRDEFGQVLPPPAEFLLLILWPRSCKFLRLTDNYAQNDVRDDANVWSSTHVNA
jgi:PPOX class probable FMN-dependent enzyme